MDAVREIQEIRQRIFGEELFDSVFALYQKECSREESGNSEEKYRAAREGLPEVLSAKRYAWLREAELCSLEIAQWLTEFAFTQGVYAGYQKHFVPCVPADQFKTLVFHAVLQMPGMQRYPEYCARRKKANESFIKLRKRMSPAVADQITEIELTWQKRFLGVCRFAFPLGYRFAFSLMEEAGPPWRPNAMRLFLAKEAP